MDNSTNTSLENQNKKPMTLEQIKKIKNTIGMRDALIEALEYAEIKIIKLEEIIRQLQT
tara:strand:+ start:325 stop:501 length:177 start_codon:yes stop_codon:yes gene_type:complete